jgi:hypothetical protein
MNLQYISDSKGETSGVFIPIDDWNKIIEKIVEADIEISDIPDWHIEEVRKRIRNFKYHKEVALDFETAMDEIESEL